MTIEVKKFMGFERFLNVKQYGVVHIVTEFKSTMSVTIEFTNGEIKTLYRIANVKVTQYDN